MVYAYALYALLTNKKIIIFTNTPPRLPKLLNKNIKCIKDNIGAYHGQWYSIQKKIVCGSDYLERLKLDDNSLIKLQSRTFRSKKVINFYKGALTRIEYNLLRDKVLARKLDEPVCFLFPNFYTYRVLTDCHLVSEKYVFSRLLGALVILLGMISNIKKIVAGLMIKPVFVKRQKGLVLKQLIWGIGKPGFSDDMLVDNDKINPSDMVYYYEEVGAERKKGRQGSLEKARKLDYKVIAINKRFNINKYFFIHLIDNVLAGLVNLLFALIRYPYLLLSLADFHGKAFNCYKLHSFCEVSYQWSIGIQHDIVETIAANRCRVTMFAYHWSDAAQSYYYQHAFTVQNYFFYWGPIMEKYQFRRSLHDRGYAIGSVYSNCLSHESSQSLLEQLKLDSDRPVIVFYDSPPADHDRFPRSLFEEFMEIIREFKIKNPYVQVLLKPKSVTEEHRRYLGDLDVKLLGYHELMNYAADLSDILRIATLNVGMGIVAPITISLMMGKPGIFYDTAGNYNSPLAKYEGELVFRDRESLLIKIDQYLKGETMMPDIPELKDYNVSDTDPIEILRKYVTTGEVDEKYRLF